MKKPPDGWPQISSALFYDDAAAAIDWLCKAFGFEVRRASRSEPLPCKSPRALGGANTQALCVFVDDVDAHCARVRAAAADERRRRLSS